jgi:putative transferase (TIGR04331 family)
MKSIPMQSPEIIRNGELWGSGVVLEKLEILKLSEHISELYIHLIEELSLVYKSKYDLSQDALRIILRNGVTPITHCFFERLIRLNKIVNSRQCKPTVAFQGLFSIPNTIEEFHERINTQEFNQSVISLLAEVWELNNIDAHQFVEPSQAKQPAFINNLFRIDKGEFTRRRILRGVSRCIKWLPPLGRFPVLEFANSTGSLDKRFFYLKNFKEVDEGWIQEPVEADLVLRESILNKSQLTLNAINNFLSIYDFSEKQKDIITKLYFKFLKASLPLQFLEGFQNNYNAAKKVLMPFKVRALLFSSAGGTRSSFVVGVAKSLGFKIINAQHGGHYGYLKDVSPILEIEWPMCDLFLTWGWTQLPRHPAIKQMRTYPLPSPWLSERKFYWKDLVIGGHKSFDILWMPNMMKKFTGPPQGASSSRRDVIDDFSDSMIDFIRNAAESKIRVYCKPYNLTTLKLMADTYDSMRDIGGDFLVCQDRFDKGLTYELLNKCKLILWDQPGTGFMECIACNIPTMILWPRIYCEEEAWCIDDFNYLEEVGLIHRTSKSLINEIQQFLIDPVTWMIDSQRKLAVQSFTNKYALTDDQWWKSWRTYLKQLKNEINEKY